MIAEACSFSGDAGIDSDRGIHIDGGTVMATGNMLDRISESAQIEPPAIIGNNSEIRHGAYLRGNVIVGENCVIGNSSEIKNAILLDRVQVPHYNYVGDSMLGRGAHLGAGAICSNLKSGGSNV